MNDIHTNDAQAGDADFDARLKAMLNADVDAALHAEHGARRVPPPFQPREKLTTAATGRRFSPWIVPLAVAATVAALTVGTVAVVNTASNDKHSNPATNGPTPTPLPTFNKLRPPTKTNKPFPAITEWNGRTITIPSSFDAPCGKGVQKFYRGNGDATVIQNYSTQAEPPSYLRLNVPPLATGDLDGDGRDEFYLDGFCVSPTTGSTDASLRGVVLKQNDDGSLVALGTGWVGFGIRGAEKITLGNDELVGSNPGAPDQVFTWDGTTFTASQRAADAVSASASPSSTEGGATADVEGAKIALPAGWQVRNYGEYLVPGATHLGSATWCLTPIDTPSSTTPGACPVSLTTITAPYSGNPVDVDIEGGFESNPAYCGPGGARMPVEIAVQRFAGRIADYRYWTYDCSKAPHPSSAKYEIAQYVVATNPGYIFFSQTADDTVRTAMSYIAAHSVLLPQDGDLRFADLGIVRSVTQRPDGYHVALDRVFIGADGATGENAPAKSDYIIPQSAWGGSNGLLAVGIKIKIDTDRVKVIRAYRD